MLVYFYGGGFVAGDGSEPRYDGESMARKGIVALTVNYRLGVFGFLAHPELTQGVAASRLRQLRVAGPGAALQWVQKNIAAFGGDPAKVTIAGESAGSVSVSAQMASPLSKELIAGAIGESGSLLANAAGGAAGAGRDRRREVRGDHGRRIARGAAGDAGRADARGRRRRRGRGSPSPWTATSSRSSRRDFAAGQAGARAAAGRLELRRDDGRALLTAKPETPEALWEGRARAVRDRADEVLKAYSGRDRRRGGSSRDGAGRRPVHRLQHVEVDRRARQTGGKPVYRYFSDRGRRPAMVPVDGQAETDSRRRPEGRALGRDRVRDGQSGRNKVYAWTPDDQKVSEAMQEYFANFVKTRNPNGAGLPKWPALNAGGAPRVMRIDVETKAEPEAHRDRYLLLEAIAAKAVVQ